MEPTQNNIKSEGKQLRIAFALGGGVSLGTFSGAALTEALKNLMVTAYLGEQDYDDVVIDVFSGASAGAIALTVLIRMMISYEDKIHHLKELKKYEDCKTNEDIKIKIWKNLTLEFEGLTRIENERIKENLIICQIVQDFQELIWVDKMDIDGLGNLKDLYEPMKNTGSILNYNFLDDLTQDLIFPENFKINDFTPINERILFGCTLTRLSADKINSFKEYYSKFYDQRGLKFLRSLLPVVAKDGAMSGNHKDIRVFDIDFRENVDKAEHDSKPKRWVKIVRNSISCNPDILDIHTEESWKMITQTAQACGAFPFAFEPKALNRKSYELSEPDDQIYAYIDGGVLNNEPISEAFKLSSYMDGTYKHDNFDRVVIFVDPSINHDPSSKINSFFNEYQVSEETGKPMEVPGLLKMIRTISPVTNVRKFYCDTVQLGFPDTWEEVEKKEEIINKLEIAKQEITETIHELQKKIAIPATYPLLDIELRKILREDANQTIFSKEFHQKFKNYYGSKAILLNPKEFIKANENLIKDYVIFLYFLLIDCTLDLVGKNSNSALIPIGPVKIVNDEIEPIELLGQPFAGFLGFFHKKIRELDFLSGKKSAYSILCDLNIINECKLNNEAFTKIDAIGDKEIKELKANLTRFLEKRIFNELLKDNSRTILNLSGKRFGLTDYLIGGIISAGKGKFLDIVNHININQELTKTLEIRIKVSNKNVQVNYICDQFTIGSKDIPVTKIEGELFLILNENYLYRSFHKKEDTWLNSNYVQSDELQLVLDGWIKDRKLINIPLPKNILDEVNQCLYPVVYLDLSNIELNEDTVNENRIGILSKIKKEWKIKDWKTPDSRNHTQKKDNA